MLPYNIFFGTQPFVSGNDWAEDPRAPWNQEEPLYETCPYCAGDGGVYYNENGDILEVVDYERLSEEDKSLWEFEKCEHCDGIGTIITEAPEPDYDNYD